MEDLAQVSEARRQTLEIENPVGRLETLIEFDGNRSQPDKAGIGFVRTARKLMEGFVFVPE